VKIDIFAHICPKSFIDHFSRYVANPENLKGVDWPAGWPMLWDVDKRLATIEKYEDYVQLLVPTGPPPGVYQSPGQAMDSAGAFNDGLADIVMKHPHKFIGAVAYVPTNYIDVTLKEIDRAIDELGFKGIYLDTPIYQLKKNGGYYDYDYGAMKPLDASEFWPIYESMSRHNLPIWIHPRGKSGVPVYPGEERGQYQLAQILGWPLESATAMCRLVCSGVLDEYPDLKFIIHHCGSGIIPALAGRLDYPFDFVLKGTRSNGKDPFKNKSPIEYLRMFYADTALCGDAQILKCGHAFFGPEHMLFGTDYPYDQEGGDAYIRRTIDAIKRMGISADDEEKIFEGNARRILNL